MRPGPAATGFAAAAVVGFALGRLLLPGGAPPPPSAEPRVEWPARMPPTLAPATSGPVPPGATGPDDVALPVGEGAAPGFAEAGAAFPHLDVRVATADGRPAHGLVYALPAGAPGVDDEGAASVRPVQEGEARLHVASAGTYDVGAVGGGAGHVLATDVSIPGPRLDLRYPAPGSVRVTLAPALVARLRAGDEAGKKWGPVSLRLDRVSGRVRGHPGRGDAPVETRTCVLTAAAPSVACEVASGARYRLTPHAAFALRSDRQEAGAGDAVTLSPAGFVVRFRPRFEPAAFVFQTSGFFVFELRVEPGGGGARVGWNVAEGRAVASLDAGERPFHSTVESGELRWSGEGIEPGSTTFRADPTGEAVVTPTVVVRGSPREAVQAEELVVPDEALPPEPPPAYVSLASGEPVPSMEVVVGPPEVGWSLDEEDGRVALRFDTDAPAGALAVVSSSAGWVSAPVPVRSAPGRAIELVRGGHLVLVPDRSPPEGLALQIRRADGAPFLSNGEAGTQVEATPGTVLGPLEPGVVRFVLSLGGRDVGEVAPVVTPGAYRPLPLSVGPIGGR